MKPDRTIKLFLLAITVFLGVIAFSGKIIPFAEAQRAGEECAIPKSWGRVPAHTRSRRDVLPGWALTNTYFTVLGFLAFHSRTNRCASATCFDVIISSTRSRAFEYLSCILPVDPEAARLNHI